MDLIKRSFRIIVISLAAFLFVFIAGCNAELQTPVDPTLEEPVITEVAPTPDMTATSDPALETPLVLLVSAADADPLTIEQVRLALEPLATAAGMNLETHQDIASELITPSVQLVVGVGADLDLVNFASASPDISFVWIDAEDGSPQENLSIIGDSRTLSEHQAFMAGYLAALISNDYKVAALIPSESADRDTLAQSFENGARFYCGLCLPQYPPHGRFPQWEALAPGSSQDTFRPVINQFKNLGVDVIYVAGALAEPDLLANLAESGITVVGDSPPDVARNNWAGTIIMDPGPALAQIWPDLVSGRAGVQVPASVRLVDVQSERVSNARLRLFDEVLADLQSGMISPVTVP